MTEIKVGSKWYYEESSPEDSTVTIVHVSSGNHPTVVFEFSDGSCDCLPIEDFLESYTVVPKKITKWIIVDDTFQWAHYELFDTQKEAEDRIARESATTFKTVVKAEWTE